MIRAAVRYGYLIWLVLKRSLTALVLGTAIAVLIGYGLIQLDVSKRYLGYRLETWLNRTYQGHFRLGEIRGLIPFNARLEGLEIRSGDTLALVSGPIGFGMDLQALLRREIRFEHLTLDRLELRSMPHLRAAFRSGVARPIVSTDSIRRPIPDLSIRRIRLLDADMGGLTDVHLDAALQIHNERIFLDIHSAGMRPDPARTDTLFFTGQLYKDDRYIELNGFRSGYRNSRLRAGATLDLNPEAGAEYLVVRVDSASLVPEELRAWLPALPDTRDPLLAKGEVAFQGADLLFRGVEADWRRNRLRATGRVGRFADPAARFWEATLDGSHLVPAAFGMQAFQPVDLRGMVSGTGTRVDTDLWLMRNGTWVALAGSGRLGEVPSAEWTMRLSEVDLSGWRTGWPETELSGRVEGAWTGRDLAGPHEIRIDARLDSSRVGRVRADSLFLKLDGSDRVYRPDMRYFVGAGSIRLAGRTDFRNPKARIILAGNGTRLDLRRLTGNDALASTDLDLTTRIELEGDAMDRLSGAASVDVARAVVGGSQAEAHQFYMDLNDPDADERVLRFTSSIADLVLRGDAGPRDVARLGEYWARWMVRQAREQLLLQPALAQTLVVDSTMVSANLIVEASVKRTGLLRQYWPSMPDADLMGDWNLLVNATPERLLVNGGLAVDSLRLPNLSARTGIVQFAGEFHHGSNWSESLALDVVAQVAELRVSGQRLQGYDLNLRARDSIITVDQRIEEFGRNARFDNQFRARIGGDAVHVVMHRFELGSDRYRWTARGEPELHLDTAGRLEIRNLYLANADQVIDLSGTLSPAAGDSVTYGFRNVDLARISELVGGRVRFGGMLNATFTTKSLTREPQISGTIRVGGLVLNDRPVGDVDFRSRLNPRERRFDTRLAVIGPNTDVRVEGFVFPPPLSARGDTLYAFDVDVRKADLWVVHLFNPLLFDAIEGTAVGEGWVTGGTNGFDFDSRFEVDATRLRPYFLLTDYTAKGPIRIGRSRGLVIDTLSVRDRFGGQGKFYGKLDFNDFKPSRPLDFTMEMTNLQFLNNGFTDEVPFYGSVAGTGVVTLTGRTTAPFLRTRVPVTTTTSSRLSIPFLDETQVQEQARFVEFVRNFQEVNWEAPVAATPVPGQAASVVTNTFMELFTLDLTFNAPAGSNVQLVFDPLTGEVLNTRGSGVVRLTLQDQAFQVFGSFNVTDGEYTFVAGDIFTRRFALRDGGTIRWEGPADNPSLNVLAAYRSRPDISVLSPTLAGANSRIPVDLMLRLSGSVAALQNDFYFEFPNSVDVSQNASELALLNSDEQKLIQATALLFTGGFLPTGNVNANQGNAFTTDFQRNVGTVGLSQVLSNQLNTLLNSGMRNLDIDFNLTGFDQADVGVALRLFNDRLVLRGESSFNNTTTTGAEYSIGDLGATYRINRALSIEIFHRRDPTLRAIVGNTVAAETINGVGLEAQFQFNTWREFGQRIWGSVRRFFAYFGLSNE